MSDWITPTEYHADLRYRVRPSDGHVAEVQYSDGDSCDSSTPEWEMCVCHNTDQLVEQADWMRAEIMALRRTLAEQKARAEAAELEAAKWTT